MKKRIFALVTALALCLTMLPTVVLATNTGLSIADDTTSTSWSDDNGGSATYNAESHTLTLTNYNNNNTDDDCVGITYTGSEALTIVLVGSNTLNCGHGIKFTGSSNDLTIKGSGTLTVQAQASSNAAWLDGVNALTVTDGATVTAAMGGAILSSLTVSGNSTLLVGEGSSIGVVQTPSVPTVAEGSRILVAGKSYLLIGTDTDGAQEPSLSANSLSRVVNNGTVQLIRCSFGENVGAADGLKALGLTGTGLVCYKYGSSATFAYWFTNSGLQYSIGESTSGTDVESLKPTSENTSIGKTWQYNTDGFLNSSSTDITEINKLDNAVRGYYWNADTNTLTLKNIAMNAITLPNADVTIKIIGEAYVKTLNCAPSNTGKTLTIENNSESGVATFTAGEIDASHGSLTLNNLTATVYHINNGASNTYNILTFDNADVTVWKEGISWGYGDEITNTIVLKNGSTVTLNDSGNRVGQITIEDTSSMMILQNSSIGTGKGGLSTVPDYCPADEKEYTIGQDGNSTYYLLADGEVVKNLTLQLQPLMVEYTIDIDQQGSIAPDTALTFEVNVIGYKEENISDENKPVLTGNTVTTKEDHTGTLVFTGESGKIANLLSGAFIAQTEPSSEDDYWRFSDEVYCIEGESTTDYKIYKASKIEEVDPEDETTIISYQVKTDDDGKPVEAEGSKIVFHNTYTAYMVEFDLNGGEGSAPVSIQVSYNNIVSKPAETEMDEASRTGFTFDGKWYTDTACTKEYDFDTPVTKDITLYAGWVADSTPTPSGSTYYTIKASAGEGGAISPSGSVSVKRGKDKSFTITADEGWRISEVLVDGVSVGAVGSYTFENVRKGHTIEVSFAKNGGVPSGLNGDEHGAYINGYPDGLVHPNEPTTRAETAAMLYRLLTAERRSEIETEAHSFTDIPADAWYRTAVATMANGGYVTGYEDGRFGGNDNVTRAQFVTMLARFVELEKVDCSFSDLETSHWAYGYIANAAKNGWVTGDVSGAFRPDEEITRAEAMTIINRVLERGVDSSSVLLDFKQWADNQPGAWYYYEVIEATNGHEYTGRRPSERWTALK